MFDVHAKYESTSRFPVIAHNGMVCTGHNLAAAAGSQILQQGGNAIDAAIATAATLTVVEPTANGLGSDAFAIVWHQGKLYGLNSSGCSPMAISREQVIERHGTITEMPKLGWTPVTVPGAVKAWAALHERFGRLPFETVLAPAIQYAKDGFALTPEVARMWEKAYRQYSKHREEEAFQEWFTTFAPKGVCPRAGDRITLPHHADTLQQIADTKGKAFYEGSLADQIEADSRFHHGFLRKEDLIRHQVQWVTPLHVSYHGYEVWELPPNGQGIVALNALNILKEFSFAKRDEQLFHHQFEAMKMAFADGKQWISDPAQMKVEIAQMIDPAYGKFRADQIQENAVLPVSAMPYQGGTVYLCTADHEGNMVSFIQSNYMGFGSGIVVKDTGIALQNRGSDFSLNVEDVNVLQPNKRSYHTIIPGFLTKAGNALGPFGVMGGYMQPQGHVQVIMNLVDFQMNPQLALDMPRWQWIKEREFLVESTFDKDIVKQLEKRGHKIFIEPDAAHFGRGQMILRMENGTLIGGCESRTDSNIACF